MNRTQGGGSKSIGLGKSRVSPIEIDIGLPVLPDIGNWRWSNGIVSRNIAFTYRHG